MAEGRKMQCLTAKPPAFHYPTKLPCGFGDNESELQPLITFISTTSQKAKNITCQCTVIRLLSPLPEISAATDTGLLSSLPLPASPRRLYCHRLRSLCNPDQEATALSEATLDLAGVRSWFLRSVEVTGPISTCSSGCNSSAALGSTARAAPSTAWPGSRCSLLIIQLA